MAFAMQACDLPTVSSYREQLIFCACSRCVYLAMLVFCSTESRSWLVLQQVPMLWFIMSRQYQQYSIESLQLYGYSSETMVLARLKLSCMTHFWPTVGNVSMQLLKPASAALTPAHWQNKVVNPSVLGVVLCVGEGAFLKDLIQPGLPYLTHTHKKLFFIFVFHFYVYGHNQFQACK